MATNARDVKLTLGVETTGAESINKLATDLSGVASAGKNAAPKALPDLRLDCRKPPVPTLWTPWQG
jgi:hypothetical protein